MHDAANPGLHLRHAQAPTAWAAARPVAAVIVAAAMLIWPALLNGYPIIFTDSAAYLMHSITGGAPWDKTAAYGPFLHLFHQGLTLWLPVAAQGLILSYLLFLVQRAATGHASPAGHLVLAAGLAACTAAPWFAAMLMPDFFTPVVVLCLFLLGFAEERLSRAETIAVGVIGSIAVAVHLSHLPTALALVVLVLLLRRSWRPVLRAALPVLTAVLFLLSANWVAFGRPTLSPHGSVFLLARLQADGPAVALLRARCPDAGWYMCDFIDRMPMDSDTFLWNPMSPPAMDSAGTHRPLGALLLAPEARVLVGETLRAYPLDVARAALGNWWEQLLKTEVGDTFDNIDLQNFGADVIAQGFPLREAWAFEASRQMQGDLASRAAPVLLPQQLVLGLSAAVMLVGAWRLRRRPHARRLSLALCILVGVMGNALATGALSKPHHRYQARIVWLLPLGAALLFWPLRSDRGGAVARARPGAPRARD